MTAKLLSLQKLSAQNITGGDSVTFLMRNNNITGVTGSPTQNTYTLNGVNYRVYVFTGTGTITFAKSGLIQCALLGGGAVGANWASDNPFGGGAASYIENSIFIDAGTYTCTVGGGNGGVSFIGLATNTYRNVALGSINGNAASGFSSSLGFNTGSKATNSGPGGGGIGGAGGNAFVGGGPTYNGGTGGIGIFTTFTTGSNVGIGGGGGGLGGTTGGAGATTYGSVDGLGGYSAVNTNHAPANRGGGGGGGWNGGSNGGSGFVAIRVLA